MYVPLVKDGFVKVCFCCIFEKNQYCGGGLEYLMWRKMFQLVICEYTHVVMSIYIL